MDFLRKLRNFSILQWTAGSQRGTPGLRVRAVDPHELTALPVRAGVTGVTYNSGLGKPSRNLLLWIAPCLLAVALYWGGLTAWFQKDDFAWLGLWNALGAGKTWTWLLFEPFAQGTVRIFSDRLFFTPLYALFGLNPLPYHLAALATFLIALTLLQSIAAKLTGSRIAAFWAAIFWTVNAALAAPLAWASFYNEVMWACFLLIDVWLLLRYIETGDNRFYIAQWATFLLGFGVLEINIVYPAIALAIVWCRAKRDAWKFAWMFPASVVFAIVHFLAAPAPSSGPYQLHWDLHIFRTLAMYSYWALGTGWSGLARVQPMALRIALAAPIAAGLIAFLVAKIRERQWIVLVFPAWFLIVLAPLLPLRDHVDYGYLTVPEIGLAMWGGWALVSGWNSWRWLAGLAAAIYIGISVPTGLALTAQWHDRALRLHNTFDAVATLHRDRGGAVIFQNPDSETYNDMIVHGAFGLIGIQEVYVAGQNDRARARLLIDQGRGVVYDLAGGVRDVTAGYRASLGTGETLAAKIELGAELFAAQLGPTWYRAEDGYRWMPRRASVTLPLSGRRIYVRGFAPAAALKSGPVRVTVSAALEKLGSAAVARPESPFELAFDLPAKLGGTKIEIAIELDRTFTAPPDPRELGLPITSIEIKD